MRKVLLLAASALLVPGVALADSENAAPTSPMFVGASVGWTTMDMPEHQNGTFTFDFGGGFEPLTEQADVDGVTYALGIGKDLSSGWRVGVYARFFDGDGSASSTVAIPFLTATRLGTMDGALVSPIFPVTDTTAAQTLDVDVTDYSVAVSAGRAVGDLRADLVVSYGAMDSEYQNVAIGFSVPPVTWATRTTFSSNTVEVAVRLSADFRLADDLTLNVGGSGGYGLRNVDMNARRTITNSAGSVSSAIGTDEDVNGFIGRFDAALGYEFARSTTIALTANYMYDDIVPVYVAPVYGATVGAIGSPATFTTEGQSSMTYGVRVVGRF